MRSALMARMALALGDRQTSWQAYRRRCGARHRSALYRIGSSMTSPVRRVKSAERALDVIELLADALRPVPTMAIARQAGMPKSSTHHLLNALRERGWATYHADQRGWTLGPAAQIVAHGFSRGETIRWAAAGVLEELARATGMVAQIALLDGGDTVFLDRVAPNGDARDWLSAPGLRVPAYRTALGRALLMHRPLPQLRALYGDRSLAVGAGGTVTLNALVQELAVARTDGVVTQVGMLTPGVRCIAAPVPTSVSSVPPTFAVGVSVATTREPAIDAAVQRGVREAARRLGHAQSGQPELRTA
jgi:IclR family transcriptional regulator, acetate operon repressor